MPAESLVVCLGDSNTQGQFSANYVKRLQDRWPGTRFINAGVNGQLAYNITQRLDEVVAQQPDVVTLLVGTNDVNAQFDASWLARYRMGPLEWLWRCGTYLRWLPLRRAD